MQQSEWEVEFEKKFIKEPSKLTKSGFALNSDYEAIKFFIASQIEKARADERARILKLINATFEGHDGGLIALIENRP